VSAREGGVSARSCEREKETEAGNRSRAGTGVFTLLRSSRTPLIPSSLTVPFGLTTTRVNSPTSLTFLSMKMSVVLRSKLFCRWEGRVQGQEFQVLAPKGA
jgi:hypothetical protein